MTTSQDAISAVVRLLLTVRHETQETVAEALGLPRASLSNRLAGRTRWTSDDLDRLAAHFGIDPAVLLMSPAEILGPELGEAPPSPNGAVPVERRRSWAPRQRALSFSY